MNSLFSVHWVLAGAVWYFVNGLLHDIFVLMGHKGSYNRELLRLLTDGHLLMLSGGVLFVGYLLLLQKVSYGALLGILVSLGMIVYCLMIFPFLKSFGTLLISAAVAAVCVRLYLVS